MSDFISNLPEEHQPIWVAVGSYSHTDNRKLWKVVTSPVTRVSAEIFAEMANKNELSKPERRRRHHFVVKLDSREDYSKKHESDL